MELNNGMMAHEPDALKIDMKQRKINRLRWLNVLRWFAIGAVILALSVARTIYPLKLPFNKIGVSLAILALTNIVYILIANRLSAKKTPMRTLNQLIFSEVTTDFLLLGFIIHFTGGICNFFSFFYVFHVVIACLIVRHTISVYAIALAGWLMVLLIAVAESRGWLPHYGLGPYMPGLGYVEPRYMLHILAVLAFMLFGMAYIGLTLNMMIKRREDYITHLKDQLEDWNVQLAEANTRLVEVDRAKTQFMRMSGHEMKAPLSSMLTLMRTIVEGYVEDRGKIIEMIALASQRGNEALEMANELLALAREKGKDLEPVEFDIAVETGDEIKRLQQSAMEHSVEISFEFVNDPLKMKADVDSFRLAVRNIISNAIKYSNAEGIVKIDIKRLDGDARITVTDHGIGIPADHLPKLFEEFNRAPNAREHTKGTGLGMTIVRRALQNIGGGMDINSIEGRGTVVTLTIPLNV